MEEDKKVAGKKVMVIERWVVGYKRIMIRKRG